MAGIYRDCSTSGINKQWSLPVEDDGAVGLALHDVAGQLVMETRQQQWRNAPGRRQPVLEHVV